MSSRRSDTETELRRAILDWIVYFFGYTAERRYKYNLKKNSMRGLMVCLRWFYCEDKENVEKVES